MDFEQGIFNTLVSKYFKSTVLSSDRPKLRGSERRSVQIGDQLSLTLTLSLTLPNLNLTVFPSIPCLVSGHRYEPIIIHFKILF